MSSSSSMALLPTTVAMSAEDAIKSIMGDIPLFCEGVMGIGVFTFFFLTKQVKLALLSLYGSCLFAFAAATLDLGQVLIRRQSSTASLISIDGVINAREVFLSLSLFALDLFFWYLVALCPRDECAMLTNNLSTGQSGPSMHSASWNRWGIVGTVLKYGSLAAVISVPLLSLVWRLMPNQHSYSGTYVSQSIIQTSIMAIFLLKIFLNVSISPADPWCHALFSNAIPLISLVLGIALGVGNLVSFAFTETILGRFLLAVEVYLLIVYSLFNAFYEQKNRHAMDITLPSTITQHEKSQYIPSDAVYRLNRPSARDSKEEATLSWAMLPRNVVPDVSWRRDRTESRSVFELELLSQQARGVDKTSLNSDSETNQRPGSGMSLSYYAMKSDIPLTDEEAANPPTQTKYSPASDKNASSKTFASDIRPTLTQAAFIGNEQRSISSLDEIIRQQDELDQTILAFRLASTSMQQSVSDASKKSTIQSRSTGSRTESLSNRSDFSLSVFPDPPIIPTDEVATKYALESEAPKGVRKQRSRTKNFSIDYIVEYAHTTVDSSVATIPVQNDPTSNLAPVYDVTSFIGDLSQVTPGEIPDGESNSSPIVPPAQLDPLNGLRPMILAASLSTQVLTSASIASPSQQQYDDLPRLSSSTGLPSPLRPLLLGTPAVNSASIRPFTTKVSLAQRRQRGGTISSDTRRPVISAPRMNKDTHEGIVAVFERPRPPPFVVT